MRIDLSKFVKASDVRGIVPDQLCPSVAEALGAAFARVVASETADTEQLTAQRRPRVVIGNDMRESSPALVAAFARGTTDAGVDVVQIGLCSTDGLYFASGAFGLAGAMFTASHNPAEYNGIKMCWPGARPVGESTGLTEIRHLAQRYLDTELPAPIDRPGTISQRSTMGDYGRFLREQVDLRNIRPLKVVIDAGNGMAGLTAPAVLGTSAGLPPLPLELVPLYWELDGSFPNHEANPLEPENLVDLQRVVVEQGADLGLAFDGDADRCFVVDEQGAAVSPSAITILVGLREVRRAQAAGQPHPAVIHNLITSRAVSEQLAVGGARPVRTKVGHALIKAQMAEQEAVFGGEHSAHYYYRDFWYADSGMLTALHVLAELGEQPLPLSHLATRYAPYFASGEINSRVADVAAARERVLSAVREQYCDLACDELDGVTVSRWRPDLAPDECWWFNLRASNTEPLLRLNVEAKCRSTMERLTDQLLSWIRDGTNTTG